MSEAATATTPAITNRDVEDWCALAQVKDGRKIFQSGAVLRPWCAGMGIHAEVKGSGSTPYKIDITFKEGGSAPSTKCSCPAWRTNHFCKHVTAVLLAWVGKPGSFAVVEAPPTEVKEKPARAKKPASDAGGAGADTPKKAKTDEQADAARLALLESGLVQATDLLTELCARGLLATTPEQADAVLKLAELLISQKLRALGRDVQLLAIRLRQLSEAKSKRGSQPDVDEVSFAALLADAWITLAATKRALQAGPNSEDGSTDFEDLIGTEFRAGRLSVSAQSQTLLEVGFEEVTDETHYTIFTSYLLDLDSGELMLDRKIVPERLAERERKKPYQSLLLNCEIAGSRSQPPHRVKLSAIGQKQPITAEALIRAAKHAVTTVAVLRRRLAEQMADPLAERELLALFAPETLQVIDAPPAQGRGSQSLLLIDAEGVAIPIETASSANVILGIVTREPILALFGRLKLNERGDAYVFAPLSILCQSGKLVPIG
ncbi:MAG TPA: SWIM zinc finger family protein [Ktedonobacterales bacterium]